MLMFDLTRRLRVGDMGAAEDCGAVGGFDAAEHCRGSRSRSGSPVSRLARRRGAHRTHEGAAGRPRSVARSRSRTSRSASWSCHQSSHASTRASLNVPPVNTRASSASENLILNACCRRRTRSTGPRRIVLIPFGERVGGAYVVCAHSGGTHPEPHAAQVREFGWAERRATIARGCLNVMRAFGTMCLVLLYVNRSPYSPCVG